MAGAAPTSCLKNEVDVNVEAEAEAAAEAKVASHSTGTCQQEGTILMKRRCKNVTFLI